MSKGTIEHVSAVAEPPVQNDLEALRTLFPDVFTEGRIDFGRLRARLGDAVENRPERYSFTWAGKQDAIRMLQVPAQGALVPDREASIDFDDTQHLFIEGENLEVLKLLYKAYFGRVKMIYIDPPYNTGNDFVYPDNFAAPLDTYLRLTGQKNGNGDALTSNRETSGRYHSAWLSMMYPRLFIARQLLCEEGVIFVSIDDNEVHNLKMLMNEVFGEENFVTQIEWQKRYTRSNNTDNFTSVIDHVLLYSRSASFAPNLFSRNSEADSRYSNPDNDSRGPWKAIPFLNPVSPEERPNLAYEIIHPNTGDIIRPIKKAWRSEKSVYERYVNENRLWWGVDGTSKVPNIKRFLTEVRQGMTPINLWDYQFAGHTDDANVEIKNIFGDKVFDTPKPTLLIRRMLELSTDPDSSDIILDFFAGSCSTTHALLAQNHADGGNRRCISIQWPQATPEASPARKSGFQTISEIGQERIRRVIHKMKEPAGEQLELNQELTPPPGDLGFRVFRLSGSHIQAWPGVSPEAAPEQYAEQLELIRDPLKPGWKAEDLIYEIALKEGYGLTSRINPVEEVTGAKVWRVTGTDREQHFHICLDDTLKLDALAPLNLARDHLFVCRDVAIDDTVAANLALQCRLKLI